MKDRAALGVIRDAEERGLCVDHRNHEVMQLTLRYVGSRLVGRS